MAYILDAYNVIYAGIAMGGALSGLTVRGLCQWISASPRRLKATLVLDGRAKPHEPGINEFPEIDLVYSGAGVSADAVIARMVETNDGRKKLIVVTNDRAVASHARRNSARVMSSEAFLKMLLAAARRHKGAGRARMPDAKTGGAVSSGETEHWLREFGLETPPPAAKEPAAEAELDDEGLRRLMGRSDDAPPGAR